ncbi:hypothetical protein B0H17DRAFT_1141859 [Mycena rosella]|uniref:Uncharacterized protein n=1 Tax=Mycena rosella TaxID=1033263 RepID=A0AAD7G665_MYCRO|nr:hypothetical protein B0H17DRAFT_1141859 [Mycena rosella]
MSSRRNQDEVMTKLLNKSAIYVYTGTTTATVGPNRFIRSKRAHRGSVNVNVEVQRETPGGTLGLFPHTPHAVLSMLSRFYSVPPEHTSIGMLAAMIVHLERNAPKAVLEVGMPAFQMAQCVGAHGPAMQPALKCAILRVGKSKKALQRAEALLLHSVVKVRFGKSVRTRTGLN